LKKFDFIEKNNFPSGERIKKLMAETGTNYSDLMDGGFSAVEIGFYRMGKLVPSLETAEKIINICGAGDEITAEELISREDEPPIMTLQGLDKRLTRERKLLNKGLKYLEQKLKPTTSISAYVSVFTETLGKSLREERSQIIKALALIIEESKIK